MLRTQNLTPDVYYRQSRDFQFIGRLFDVVLNSCRTESNILYSLPFSENSPDELLQLAAYTFGLKLKTTSYTSAQLRAVLQVFSLAIRNKGSIYAIDLLCRSLLRAENIDDDFMILTKDDNTELILSLPPKFSAVALLMEVLNYVLPAGVSYYITKTVVSAYTPDTELGVNTDSVRFNHYNTSSSNTSSILNLHEDVLPEYLSNKIYNDELEPIPGFNTSATVQAIEPDVNEQGN